MANNKNQILVPIDFSEQSLIALEQSYNIAALMKAGLTLIHVMEDNFKLPFTKKKQDRAIDKIIQKELTKLADSTTRMSGIKTDTVMVHGKVYEEIHNTAKKMKAALIIMGTSGEGSGLKRFIGSNALRVIRESPCPVITIKGKKHRRGCKNILLPLDLTKETKEKVTKAVEIANLFGSHIHLMSVLTTDDEFIVNKLERQMASVEEFIKKNELSCSSAFVKGDDLSDETIKYAKKIKADLVMIMTQEELFWRERFINSEAMEVINGSDIPVMTIRPKERNTSLISPFEY